VNRCEGLARLFKPDWEALVATILRQGTPHRVHHIELFQDPEISDAIAGRFDLLKGLAAGDPDYARKKRIAIQRFCGFDYVTVSVGLEMPVFRQAVADTAALRRPAGRRFQNERHGPIQSWAEFETYPWPDPAAPDVTHELEWYQVHTPDDMCLIAQGGFGHLCEHLTWLMGTESFCYALYDQRDLVQAIADRLIRQDLVAMQRILEFDRVKLTWGSDDMGYKTGVLFAPDDLRAFVLTGHRQLAALSHAAGRPYLLHSCGNLAEIMADLTDLVQIDGKHSFEDTIEDVREVKQTYGKKIALLGGLDVDFLCRADEQTIRQRVRDTLNVCQPGGGYCLGTGNTVANYIPVDNYLAMLDEGRLYGA
jgi:uroporphyrinogen decarboxylase